MLTTQDRHAWRRAEELADYLTLASFGLLVVCLWLTYLITPADALDAFNTGGFGTGLLTMVCHPFTLFGTLVSAACLLAGTFSLMNSLADDDHLLPTARIDALSARPQWWDAL